MTTHPIIPRGLSPTGRPLHRALRPAPQGLLQRLLRGLLPALLAGAVTILAPAAPDTLAAQAPEALELADSLSRTVHRAAVRSDLEGLRSARRLAERALTLYPDHPLLEHHLGETFYRESTRWFEEDPDSAQALLERAQEVLDAAAGREGAIPETQALRASVLGMRITGMLRAMTLGPRAGAAIERALEEGPENPRVWLASGIGTLNRPGFLGGGAEPALEELQRAQELFEDHEPQKGHPRGGAAELQAWIGIARLQLEQRAAAEAAFRRALELEPEYAWVRHVLLPRLERSATGR